MPVRNLAQYLEDTADPQALADEAEGTVPFEGELETLNPDFERKVRIALEYAMAHQRLNEEECHRRRNGVDGWLTEMRRPGYYREWAENANRIAARHLESAPTQPTTPLTPEEQAEYEERRARWLSSVEERHAEENKRKAAANERAERLLRSTLNAKQLRELDCRGYFHVESSFGVGRKHVESHKRRFRITRGRNHNVLEVDARGRILRRFCAHPTESVPDADTMLAQKFMIECKPKVFFKIANVTRPIRRARLAESIAQASHIARERCEEAGLLHSLIERAQEEALDATALHDTPDGRAA